jgi:hypothetical protein
VEVHHIDSWSEEQAHHPDNLIALCPNCHDLADRGAIDRKALRELKVKLAISQLHAVVQGMIDPADPFDPFRGSEALSPDETSQLVLEIQARGMLAGVLVEQNWPLVHCTLCERLGPIDRFWTPQDESFEETLRTYCARTCAREYQRLMNDWLATIEHAEYYTSEYMLQNTVEMTSVGNGVFRRGRVGGHWQESRELAQTAAKSHGIDTGIRVI